MSLGTIVLPGVPRIGNKATPDEIAKAVSVWTQQAERAVREIERALKEVEERVKVLEGP